MDDCLWNKTKNTTFVTTVFLLICNYYFQRQACGSSQDAKWSSTNKPFTVKNSIISSGSTGYLTRNYQRINGKSGIPPNNQTRHFILSFNLHLLSGLSVMLLQHTGTEITFAVLRSPYLANTKWTTVLKLQMTCI